VEALRHTPTTLVHGVRLLRGRAVAAFFEGRGFEPAWTAPESVDALLRAIRGVHADGLTPDDYHLAAIERARAGASSVELEADLQVLAADAAAALVDHVRYGKVRPSTLDRRWNVDPRMGSPPLEALLDRVFTAGTPADAIDSLKPGHFIYAGLKNELARLRAIADAGGWPQIPAGPALKPGARDVRLDAVRRRLAITGEHTRPSTSFESDVYDEELEWAVRLFQERHRLHADGAIGRMTLDAMNVSAASRVDQVRINLERARWVVGGLSNSFLLVNLPAFKAYFIRDGKNVWETRAQIGRQARETPAFRADLRYIVFNPDWTVPPTILEQDVLAGMRKGQNTVARKGLTILDRQGRPVDPATIDWATASAKTFGYTLRQPPGPDNALGRVKFIFPNEHAIFLHDTPSQELFTPDQRTFSSGCIRIEHPLGLAAELLRPDGWTPNRVQAVVDAGVSETVFLREPLSVVIVYWTVSVGASGELRFARDVYDLDAPVLRALNAKG
jgi:murein L,D-transpeptidase YcbB/YkuD